MPQQRTEFFSRCCFLTANIPVEEETINIFDRKRNSILGMQGSDARSTCFSFDADRLAESGRKVPSNLPAGPVPGLAKLSRTPWAVSPAAGRYKALPEGRRPPAVGWTSGGERS